MWARVIRIRSNQRREALTEPSCTDQKKAAAAKFLDSDFTQCFQQLRYYDGQIVDICKFSFTGYLAVIGAVLALYKYGLDSKPPVDFTLPATAVLFLAAVIGFIMLGLIVRNRVYFVLMARYVNEQRGLFLRGEPLGFRNTSRMWTDPKQPPYFSPGSSQSFMIYMVSLLNASMLALAGFLICASGQRWWCLLAAIAVLVAQVLAVMVYLVTREGRSAGKALWGEGKGPKANGEATVSR